jgi:hypothetical protein
MTEPSEPPLGEPPVSELPPAVPPGRPRITALRVVIWIVVGGVGAFLLISGIIGIIAKG